MVKRDNFLSLFFYPNIYNKLRIMIKQTWEISQEERNRILSLHESATKNLYLMSEQNTDETKKDSISLTKRVEFPSGFHSASAVNLETLIDLSKIEEFLKKYKDKKIVIKLKSSESQVTNNDNEVTPKKRLNPGDLSKMRYQTIQTFMTEWLNGLVSKGIISQVPKFINTEPIIDKTTPWNPSPGLSPSQISALAKDPKYTKHQFVEIEVNAEGQIEPKKILTPVFQKVETSRTEMSTQNPYNVALFYNYSYAPAVVLGMSQSEAESLPGALLTMNEKFVLKTPVPKLNLPATTIKIVPNGGQTVPVIVFDGGKGFTPKLDSPAYIWKKWDAYVSDSYNLEIPYPEDSKEFQSAWLFMYWYINSPNGFPQDWKFIGNKPDNVDWNSVDVELQSGGEQIYSKTFADQQKMWSEYPMNWYANMVKKVYG
jgi:hypothetical protein